MLKRIDTSSSESLMSSVKENFEKKLRNVQRQRRNGRKLQPIKTVLPSPVSVVNLINSSITVQSTQLADKWRCVHMNRIFLMVGKCLIRF